MGGRGRRTPNILKFPRKLVKSQPCCKGVSHSIFCDPFFVFFTNNSWSNGQTAPNGKCVSAHHRGFEVIDPES